MQLLPKVFTFFGTVIALIYLTTTQTECGIYSFDAKFKNETQLYHANVTYCNGLFTAEFNHSKFDTIFEYQRAFPTRTIYQFIWNTTVTEHDWTLVKMGMILYYMLVAVLEGGNCYWYRKNFDEIVTKVVAVETNQVEIVTDEKAKVE